VQLKALSAIDSYINSGRFKPSTVFARTVAGAGEAGIVLNRSLQGNNAQ
jgi:hypothetical protein